MVQPTAEIGRAAVDLLLQLIDGERYLGPALLHHTLRLGGTASHRTQEHQAAFASPL